MGGDYLELRNVEGVSQSMKLAEFAADVEERILLITERWYRNEKIFHMVIHWITEKRKKGEKWKRSVCGWVDGWCLQIRWVGRKDANYMFQPLPVVTGSFPYPPLVSNHSWCPLLATWPLFIIHPLAHSILHWLSYNTTWEDEMCHSLFVHG